MTVGTHKKKKQKRKKLKEVLGKNKQNKKKKKERKKGRKKGRKREKKRKIKVFGGGRKYFLISQKCWNNSDKNVSVHTNSGVLITKFQYFLH